MTLRGHGSRHMLGVHIEVMAHDRLDVHIEVMAQDILDVHIEVLAQDTC